MGLELTDYVNNLAATERIRAAQGWDSEQSGVHSVMAERPI
jgi:hypothetical protein